MATTDTDDRFLQELKEILIEDYFALAAEGDELASEIDPSQSFVTVKVTSQGKRRWTEGFEVITKLPDGRFFRWEYEEGNTENQDNTGPAEYGDPELTEVFEHKKVTVVYEYTTEEV